MRNYDTKEKRALAVYVFIFLLLTLGIAIGGHFSYSNFEQEFHRQAGNQVSAIAELKENALVDWRRERLIDAQSFYRNSVFSGLVERYFENPADDETKKQIISRLEFYQSFAQYDTVCLLDLTGIHRLVIPANLEEFKKVDALLMADAAASLDSGNVIFRDFQRDPNVEGKIYISILVPLFAEQSDGRPLGVLVLHVNPETYLYPYISQWPIPSDTAETLLVRRDGQDVLFLSQLRFEQDAALNLRFPLTRTDLPAVKAVLGQTGLVEGADYRGKQVLADMRPVPDSPWFLLSKVDVDEVYAPLRTRLWQTMLIIGMAIFVAGAGLLTIWRQQRVLFYRAQAEAAGALRESEEKFRKAFILSPDSVNINRLEDGMYVSINNGFTKITGYAPDEVIGKTSLELDIWVDSQDRQRLVAGLKKTGEVENLEARFRAKNGDILYGLMSASMLELNGVPHIINITRDITERKRADKSLRESEEKMRSIFRVAPTGIGVVKDRVLYEVNPRICEMTGFTMEELVGQSARTLYPTQEEFEWVGREKYKQIAEKGSGSVETRWQKKDGSIIDVLLASTPIDLADLSKGVTFTALDITERKRAEEELIRQTTLFRDLFEGSPEAIAIVDQEDRILNVNRSFETLFGYLEAEAQGHYVNDLLVSEPYLDEARGINQISLGYGQIVEREVVRHTKDGSLVNVSLIGYPVFLKQRPIGGFSIYRDITERKQVEVVLKENKAIFSSFLEHSPVYVFFKDKDTRLLMLSKNYEQMLGMPISDLLGKTMDDLFPSDLAKSMVADDQRVLNEGRRINVVEEFNGRTYETTKFPVLKDGKPYILAGFTLDITERKQAEEALKQSEEQYRLLVENQTDLVVKVDNRGSFLYVSPSYCKLFGKTETELLGHSFIPLVHKDDIEATQDEMKKLYQFPYTCEVEQRAMTKNGWRWLNWSDTAEINQNDELVSIIGVGRDITDRKRAEEALRESESRFRTLFEQAAVGVAQLDTGTGRFISINQKYCDILGYTQQEMLDLDFHTITHPDDLILDLANMQKLIAGEIHEFSMEKRYYRKDGGMVWVSLNVSPLWAVGEPPKHHIAVVEDITSRKQTEEALEKRIVALTLPLESTESITFNDLFNLEDIQQLQDDFARATGVASVITQVDGTPITTPSNFCRLCNDVIRKNPKGYINCCKSDAALGRLNPKGPSIQPCMSGGLWDAGAGISVGGKHVANWLIGQVRDETQTEEKMLNYAEIIGVDKQLFLDAFHEVPAMSREKFEQIASTLFTLASQLSNMAYQNVQQARFIAERKQAEEALRESRALFRSLVESMPQNVFSKDLDGRFIFANQHYCATEGKSLAEIIGKTDFELHPVHLAEQYWADDRHVIETKQVVEKEEIHQPLGGEISYVQVAKAPIYDADGQVKGMLGIFWDITDRKRAEEARRESERLHRKMNENSPLGMHFYKLEGEKLIFTGANPSADKLLGVENSQFIGKTIEEAFPPLAQTEVPLRYREAAANGIPWATEQIIYEDGRINGAFEVRAFQTTQQNMVAVFADITARKKAEEEIRTLNAELEQRVIERTLQLEITNKELESFSYSVSHDLRAPLRGIDGWSQALLEDYHDQLDEQGRQYIDRVRSETQRMGHLIDDMLRLSRLTRAEMIRGHVDLSALTQAIVERLRRDDPHRQVDFNIQAGVTAEGDSHLLEAALENLLDNAFKFTAKHADARIEFGEIELEGQHVFFVRDNGAGFDMAYAQKLFGAFQRMHKASEFPGTGIGLATVQRVIHRHGGRVWAEAEVERGATFYFTLG